MQVLIIFYISLQYIEHMVRILDRSFSPISSDGVSSSHVVDMDVSDCDSDAPDVDKCGSLFNMITAVSHRSSRSRSPFHRDVRRVSTIPNVSMTCVCVCGSSFVLSGHCAIA